MKMLAIKLLFVLSLSACGTVKTLNPKDGHVDISHRGQESNCEQIPRIYSGTSHFACLVNSEPSETENLGHKFGGMPIAFIDGVFCVVADTVVLPYTVFRQVKDGNITVN